MLDVRGDKSLWVKMDYENVGEVLIIEEDYYDGIVELIEQQKAQIDLLITVLNGCERIANQVGDSFIAEYVANFKNDIINGAPK